MKKLSESDNRSQMLKHFDINRPEPKQHQPINKKLKVNKTSSDKIEKNKKTKQKNSNKIKRVTLNVLKHPAKKKKQNTTKHFMGEITEHRLPKNTKQTVTFSYNPRRSNSKPTPNKDPGKKTPVSSKYMFDYSSPANEYESRQVEFGHGRTKSKEWNDEIAKKFQKEIKSYHKKRDWTDRFALK